MSSHAWEFYTTPLCQHKLPNFLRKCAMGTPSASFPPLSHSKSPPPFHGLTVMCDSALIDAKLLSCLHVSLHKQILTPAQNTMTGALTEIFIHISNDTANLTVGVRSSGYRQRSLELSRSNQDAPTNFHTPPTKLLKARSGVLVCMALLPCKTAEVINTHSGRVSLFPSMESGTWSLTTMLRPSLWFSQQ